MEWSAVGSDRSDRSGKSLSCPLKIIIESSDLSGCCRKENIFLSLARIVTQDGPALTTVAIPTTLSTLLLILMGIKLISLLVINPLIHTP